MKIKYKFIQIIAIFVFLPTTASLGQKADYSGAMMDKLRPLLEQAQAAEAKSDHFTAYEVYLKMWNLSHIPETRYFVISNCFECISDNLKRGIPMTEKQKMIAVKCPEPISSVNDSPSANMPFQHLMYSFIQEGLAVDANNAKQFDDAINFLRRSESHLNAAKKMKLDKSEIEIAKDIENGLREARRVAIANAGGVSVGDDVFSSGRLVRWKGKVIKVVDGGVVRVRLSYVVNDQLIAPKGWKAGQEVSLTRDEYKVGNPMTLDSNPCIKAEDDLKINWRILKQRTRRRSQHLPRREFKSAMAIQPSTHSRSLASGTRSMD
ncbi:MAG: hypothetical protein R3F19_32800 [Verrucomicrobiales bacterium]